MTWVDTPWPQDPKRLKTNGYDIMRYICSDWNTGPGTSMPHKRISRPELDSYIAAGVDVAVNFEDAADDYLGGYDRGKEKGQKAGTWMATELGWPSGGVCCSSIDADIGTSWGGLAQQYQRGFADGLTSAGPYLPGIYGSSIALNGANDDSTAHMFWLTAATFWSHGIQPRVVHLRQNGYWPFGSDADLNVTVLEPIGSYLKPLGVDDMGLTPEEHEWLRLINERQTNVILDTSSGHPYSLPNLQKKIDAVGKAVDTVEPSLTAMDTKIDDLETTLERAVVDAVAVALAGGIPPDLVTQVLNDAFAAATIPVTLSGHAGTPPVTP
jgi:Rv2525c-like, glycoside hydrolase-like domain